MTGIDAATTAAGEQTGRKRLYFLNEVEMNYRQKLCWTDRLAKMHREL